MTHTGTSWSGTSLPAQVIQAATVCGQAIFKDFFRFWKARNGFSALRIGGEAVDTLSDASVGCRLGVNPTPTDSQPDLTNGKSPDPSADQQPTDSVHMVSPYFKGAPGGQCRGRPLAT